MGIINSGFYTIHTFLQNHIYHIPEYQRGYSWKKEQLEDFWMDLIQLYNDEEIKNHFLGQVVVHNEENSDFYYIIDGQQRTSTSIILLDSIRKKLDNLTDEDANIDADDITSKYIGRLTQKRKDQRLILGETDKRIFESLIQVRNNKLQQINTKKLANSEKLIYEASNFFDEKLDDFLNNASSENDKYIKLKKLYKLFLENFKIMYVETDDINEAFIIFETLNARGKELATADLLKNHLFRTANSQIETVRENWGLLIDNLDTIDPTKYIRHFWNSYRSFAREKDLYKQLRKHINTPHSSEEFLNKLVHTSLLYKSIVDPLNNTFFEDNELNDRIKEIKNLSATSFIPIILAMYNKKFSEHSINSVLKQIETLIVRNIIVAGRVANKFETLFAKIANSISDNKFKTVGEINNEIKQLIIEDDKFENEFSNFTTKKSSVIRYLLRKINNYDNNETRIISDNNLIHIEHVMPKNINEWNVSKEDHQKYLNRLGNLTLLGQEYNKNASNKNFEMKKEIYSQSTIQMTKSLENLKSWDFEKIANRQKQFAKTALNIWKTQ